MNYQLKQYILKGKFQPKSTIKCCIKFDPFKNGSKIWLFMTPDYIVEGIFQILPDPQKSLTFHHGTGEPVGGTPATPISSWWLNQPIWKIWSSNWGSSSPNRDEHKKYLSCHHPDLTNPRIVEFLSRFIGMTLRTQQSLQVVVCWTAGTHGEFVG